MTMFDCTAMIDIEAEWDAEDDEAAREEFHTALADALEDFCHRVRILAVTVTEQSADR